MPPTANKGSGGCPTSSYGLICLPPISEDLQLIWTQSELTSELDDNEQLIHTFSYFPYPSLPEIALLCLCYGLQMEKVKTWFMVQRIRCGISWSSEEIEETRGRLLRSQDQLHFKPLVAMARRAAGRGPSAAEQRVMPVTRDTASSPAAFSSFRKTDVGKVEMVHRPPSLTNTRPPSLTNIGLSSLTNTRPPSLTNAGMALYTSTVVPPLQNTPRPLSHSSAMPPLQNHSRPPSHNNAVPPLQNNSRPPSHSNSGLPLQNNSRPPSYSNAGLPFYTSTGSQLQNNLQPPPYTNAGPPFYTSTTQPSQNNSRPPSHTNTGQPLQSNSGPPLYASARPPSQNNPRPPSHTNPGLPSHTNARPPSYTIATKGPVLTMSSHRDLQHHLSKRPRTEGDVRDMGLERLPSPRKETMRESPRPMTAPVTHRPTMSIPVHQHRKDSVEHGYRLTERWQDPPARGLGGSSLEYQLQHQRSADWDLSTPFNVPSLEAHIQPGVKLPSAAAGHMFDVDGTKMSAAVACLPSEEELRKRLEASSWNLDESLPTHPMAGQGYMLSGGMQANEDGSFFPNMRRQRKTKEQLTILKSFFLQCQWARREDYKKLEEITGLPRPEIIQWFGDTRYALKHGQLKWFRDNAQGCPGWLEQEQQQLQLLDSDGVSPSLPATPPASVSSQNGRAEEEPWKGERSSPAPAPRSVAVSLPNGRLEEPRQVETLPRSPSPPPPGPSAGSTPQEDDGVLEQYWDSHRQIREGDVLRLVEESGLRTQQVLDWFKQKATEPAEVEVEICMDEEAEVEICLDDDSGPEGEAVREGEEDYDDEEVGEGEEEEEEGEEEEEEEEEEGEEEEDEDDDVIIQD